MKKNVSVNRRASHDYFILESLEAGLVLKGTEVKSLREGRASIKDSFAKIEDEEAFIYNMHIPPYEFGNRFNHDPKRPRKLLLHKEELRRFVGKSTIRGLSLIPLRVYFRRGKAKLELALAKGKRRYDKREVLRRRDAEREIERALRSRLR